LHWDPKTVAQRGAAALLRFRMDFLMLAGAQRIVIEVDGAGHYADSRGYGDPARYATMMSADRDLRLSGYEVFRFGAQELRDPARAEPTLADFFHTLFDRYNVTGH
jgi:very-short-patch-repair endonuclease